MQAIYCGTSGEHWSGDVGWEDLLLEEPWGEIIRALLPEGKPRPVQAAAIEAGVLENRRHLVLSAPTNAGKSLIGHLVLIQAALRGERAILLEPLRVLARDKAEQLRTVTEDLEDITGSEIAVRLSTGDYRQENEQIFDRPPEGEIVVATPERFEALIRNAEHDKWLEAASAVVVDEAHMIGDAHRGATLEYLITFLRTLSAPPRIAFLSATLGGLDRIEEWLAPCDVVSIEERQPPLHKYVLALDEEEDSDEVVLDWTADVLEGDDAQVLIFVYQTRSAENTAAFLQEHLGDRAGEVGVLAYHSRLSSTQREERGNHFKAGQSRVIIATTSLAMGVNLPATHALVRDTMFYGSDSPRLGVGELIQMMGRAGRGEQEGTAAVVLKPSSGWRKAELEEALRTEELPTLTSAFEDDFGTGGLDGSSKVATKVAALLGRWNERGGSAEELTTFFAESLSGRRLAQRVEPALRWLRQRKLIHEEEDRYFLTALGEYAVKAMLPLPIAAGWAQLIRDLLTIDPDDELLQAWRPLDHLLLLEITHDSTPSLRRFSQRLEERVNAWCEEHPDEQPILFREWMSGAEGHSKADQVFGSLGIDFPPGKSPDAQAEWARKRAYKAMFRTLILYERSMGAKPSDLARTYNVDNLEGVEERWRDTLMWLLAGIAQILEIRSFYYHLREHCEASPRRVRRVKQALRGMRQQAYNLQDQLKYLSPLGGVLRQMRRVLSSTNGRIGIQTIRRLEEQGITSPRELASADVEELRGMGVSKRYAEQVRNYMRKRMQ